MGVRGATARPSYVTKSATAAMLPASPRHASPSPRARLRPPPSLLASPPSATKHPTDQISSPTVHRRSVDEEPVLKVVFRAYPFPPPRTPLSYPLPPLRAPNTSALLDVSASSGALGLRKRILHRWQGEADKEAQTQANCSSLYTAEADSYRSQRVAANSTPPARSTTRKRARSPLLPGSHAMDASPPFDLVEGDPILSQPRSDMAEANSNHVLGTDHRSRQYFHTECSDARPAKIPRRESSTDLDCLSDMHRKNGNAPYPLISLDDKRGERYVHTVNERNKIGSTSPYPRSCSESQQERIRILKLRRRVLEEAELDEISRIAEALGSKDITKEERNHLKADMERLSRRGVRDCLRLISRRMKIVEPGQRIEVKLHLDILPADLLRELQLVVMNEKGQLKIPASVQLLEVRSELKRLTRNRHSGGINRDRQ